MEPMVYRARNSAFGDWRCQIQQPPLRNCAPDDSRSFFRFSCTILVDGEPHDIVGFAHPAILFELGGTKLHGFVDCTFSIVPRMFDQVLVIMLYFSKYDMYVPVYFILLQVFCVKNLWYKLLFTSFLKLFIFLKIYIGKTRRHLRFCNRMYHKRQPGESRSHKLLL